MTFRTTISSKQDPTKFLKRGLKSMFGNYEATPETAPTVDANRKQTKPKAA